jgi:hypothetical protein
MYRNGGGRATLNARSVPGLQPPASSLCEVQLDNEEVRRLKSVVADVATTNDAAGSARDGSTRPPGDLG